MRCKDSPGPGKNNEKCIDAGNTILDGLREYISGLENCEQELKTKSQELSEKI